MIDSNRDTDSEDQRRAALHHLVGQKVAATRTAAGLSQEQLETAAGWFAPIVDDIEAGRLDNLQLYELTQAALALKMEIADLVPSMAEVNAAMAGEDRCEGLQRSPARAGPVRPGGITPASEEDSHAE